MAIICLKENYLTDDKTAAAAISLKGVAAFYVCSVIICRASRAHAGDVDGLHFCLPLLLIYA